MAERWTDQQLQAINSFGHNILVSAGAGSGKTAVLSERVYRHVGERKIDINNLLVLTFTNKAAAEMKNRIRNKIIKDELNLFEDKEYQLNQINKIDTAFIMTFDAYALYLIKKYHYLFNIDKNINIIDNNILSTNNSEYLDEILNEEYLKKDKTFLDILNKYCIKNDEPIRSAILDIYKNIEMIYEKDEYINNYENNFYSDKALNNLIDKYTSLLINKIMKIRSLIQDLSYYVENTNEYFINLDNLYNCKTYEDIKRNINLCEISDKKLARGSGKQASEIKKEISDLIKQLKDEVVDKEIIFNDIRSSKQDCLYLIKLAERLFNKNNEYKKNNNLYSFIDVFKMAIELVDKHEDIKNEIANSFKEILIDEYQDTNDLQDAFISRIERNNVYMVGDIKQSIYRFRNANPDLFKKKYDEYINSDSDELIELSHNFRSRAEVLDGINLVFDRTMDKKIGGADYKIGHHMISGRNEEYNQDNILEILNYEYDSKMDEFSDINKQEFEAFVIARDIKEKINKFIVNGNGVKRKAEYKDFCIIVDRTKNFDLYKQILMHYNIPSIIEADSRISDSDLISVIRAFYKLLNCVCVNDYGYDYQYSFTSLARSFLFEISDSDIYDIIKNNKYEESEIIRIINLISLNINSKSIADILDEIIEYTDLYTKLYKIKDVSNNLVKVDYLYQLAHTFNSMTYDYEEFDKYLRKVFEDEDLDIRYASQNNEENAVRIINIHKAKGLEYRICYYVGMDVRFNRADINKRIIFSKELGLIMPSYIENKGLKDTIKKDLFKYDFDMQDISEKIRLLYVGLTRAMDKMIIVGSFENNNNDGTGIVKDYVRLEYNSFKKILDSIYDDLKDNIKDIDFNDYELNRNYLKDNKKKLVIKDTNEVINIKDHIIIKPEIVIEDSFSKEAGLIDEDMILAMDFGSKLHYYLELLDFNNPDYSFIEDEYKDMIISFMNSDLMKNCLNGKAYKEYEFIYGDKDKKHGFIDLLMEYDDHFEIIDYKTKNIDDYHYDEQLNGYRKYIESISDKRVDCFLYSIVDKKYREVERK